MHRIINVFSYITAVVLVFIIIFFVSVQNLLGNQRLLDSSIKSLCRLVPLVFGIRVNVQFLNNPDPDKDYVFIANHVNLFDGFILYGYISHFIRGVELEDHFKWPVWGHLVKRLGNIPISHKNPRAALESLNIAAQAIKDGTSIAILPEGHRTRTGSLMPFHRGPFRLAKYSEVDIIPIVMKGAWERKTVLSPFVKPGVVNLIFGEPIKSDSFKDMSDKKLRDRAFDIMNKIIDQ